MASTSRTQEINAMKKTNAYQQKLKSESGASLAAALLFFVVCAAVGSIIIAAAMSSAGRMSGITSADNQRYALESARNFLEDELLSDPGNPMSYYVNDNIITATGDQYRTDYKYDSSGLDGMEKILPAMAEMVYAEYWNQDKVQATWPEKETGGAQNGTASGNSILTQSSVAAAGDSISQGNGTDSKLTGGWVPSADFIAENQCPKFSSTMNLTDGSFQKIQGTVPVKVEMIMRSDFSVHVTLTANAEETSADGETSGKNSQTLTDQFVLNPTISVDYESVLPQTESGSAGQAGTGGQPSAKNNERNIHCEIQWLTVGE